MNQITPTIRLIGPDEPISVTFPNRQTLLYVIQTLAEGVRGLDGSNDAQHTYMGAMKAMYDGLRIDYPDWHSGWPLPDPLRDLILRCLSDGPRSPRQIELAAREEGLTGTFEALMRLVDSGVVVATADLKFALKRDALTLTGLE